MVPKHPLKPMVLCTVAKMLISVTIKKAQLCKLRILKIKAGNTFKLAIKSTRDRYDLAQTDNYPIYRQIYKKSMFSTQDLVYRYDPSHFRI